MKKHSRINRILSGILAFVTLLSLMPLQAWGTESVTKEPVSVSESVSPRITRAGVKTQAIRLAAHERIEINAEGSADNAVFQWQIAHPEKEAVWINIYDATHGYLFVTLALVRNMMTDDNIARLRCRVTEGEQVRYTDPVTVQFCPEIPYIPETTPETEPIVETLPPVEILSPTEPETTAPVETAAPTVPETTAPAETAAPTEPETTAPAETVAPTVPETTAPAETVAPTVPETTAPAETAAPTVPETTAPAETLAPFVPETQPLTAEKTDAARLAKQLEAAAPAETAPAETTAPAVPETTAPAQTVPTVVTQDTAAAEAAAADPVDPENSEFVTVTIEYIRYDFEREEGKLKPVPTDYTGDCAHGGYLLDENGTQAFTSYVATLQYGSDLNTTVSVPSMVGYDAYLGNGTNAISKVDIALTGITQNVTYTVKYKPAQVGYTVRYYFQNIYDDLYVEDTDMKFNGTGFTGATPSDDILKKEVDGFLSLYYQPDSIAADGSTVFEVYYERNYYLMEFDCNGGYGAETLYNRYGSYISVPNPILAGYVFDGWDKIVGKDDEGNSVGDGTVDSLPETMPAENTAYIAVWGSANTTYTVAYWIANDDGTNTFIGSRLVDGKSGENVSGFHDLSAQMAVCGNMGHTHTDACYSCGHMHTVACMTGNWSPNTPDAAKMAVLKSLGKDEPSSGFIYRVERSNGVDFYMKLGNNWYGWSNGDVNYQESLQGDVLIEKTTTYGGQTYIVSKHHFKDLKCGHEHKIDGNHELTCDFSEHAHTTSCYPVDTQYLETADADQNVLVEGDGSTVVNVYYRYKKYTLKFYFAATQGGKDTDNDGKDDTFDTVEIVGGSTYHFGGQHGTNYNYNYFNNYDAVKMLDHMFSQTNQIGKVNATTVPALKTDVPVDRYEIGSDIGTKGRTYHYIAFDARYGDNISELWPCDVINSVQMKEHNHVWDESNVATVSAWNGEHHIWYSKNVSNETIKGRYEKLDYKLLYDPSFENHTEKRVLSFLCFWENGANVWWSYPKLFVYNIWLQCIDNDIAKAPANKKTKEKNGIYYYLETSYDVCDDSDIGGQTQPSLTGFIQNGRDGYDIDSFDTTKYTDASGVNFYYLRNEHKIYFWNHNANLFASGQGATVQYGKKLTAYGNYVSDANMNVNGIQVQGSTERIDPYPSTLEPNAYEFTGWYTTENFLEGTEMDWNSTMPDSDMTLYAKWEPVKRNVTFYTLYSDIADGGTPFLSATDVPHGSTLGTAYYEIPTAQKDSRIEGYTFIGWFYMDEDNKKRFAPDTMEITRDLTLFAEWQTSIDTTYEIKYVLGEDVHNTDYTKGMPVADSIYAHSSVGKTKTFTAKGLGDLYPAFRKKFFPTTNSHSILMNEDKTKNTYVFEYMYDDEVLYKVRYLEVSTNKVLAKAVTRSTEEAIVTEKFLPVTGYIPQSYYIRKTLAYDGDATEEPIEENVITFYYVKDTEHGMYSVEYYLENADGEYTQYESIVGTDDLKDENGDPKRFTATVRSYEGYTHDPAKNTVITYNADGEVEDTKTGNEADDPPSGIISANGLTIKLYYTRNSYPYSIEYWEAGSDINATNKDGQLRVVSAANAQAKFGSQVSWSLVEGSRDDTTLSVGGGIYEFTPNDPGNAAAEQTKTITIRADKDGSENRIIFYFTRKTVEVFYHAVCKEPVGDAAFGQVSLYSENAANTLLGATAMPATGFVFKGWYEDEACTTKVPADWVAGNHIKPRQVSSNTDDADPSNDWENHYYALFEPVRKPLTIKKEGENLDGNDSFLFRVQSVGTDAIGQTIDLTVAIQGSGQVTIPGLYCGTYTITELTDWSWTYVYPDKNGEPVENPTQTVTMTTAADAPVNYSVTFANRPKTESEYKWLHGEKHEDNHFSAIS